MMGYRFNSSTDLGSLEKWANTLAEIGYTLSTFTQSEDDENIHYTVVMEKVS